MSHHAERRRALAALVEMHADTAASIDHLSSMPEREATACKEQERSERRAQRQMLSAVRARKQEVN